MVAGGRIQPGSRVLAGVGKALAGTGAQQLQEGQLHHAHRGAIGVHVGELGWEGAAGEGAPFAQPASPSSLSCEPLGTAATEPLKCG